MAIICTKIKEGNNPHKDHMTSIKINKIEDLIEVFSKTVVNQWIKWMK